MKRKLTCSLGLLALALCWGALPVLAASITMTGTYDGASTLTPTGTPGVYIQNFTGDGQETTFGSFVPTAQSTVDFSNPPHIVFSNGMLSAAFSNGTLFGTTSGDGTGNGNGTATFTIDWVITGGTGYFAGDTGAVTMTGLITQTGPTTESISNGSFTGTISTPSVPEPNAAILLGTALLAIAFGLGWRKSA